MPLPTIPLRCYPCFHACHLANVNDPTTAEVEELGANVIAAGPAVRGDLLPQFISQVCQWGGRRGPSIAARVLDPANNDPARRLESFNAAINALAGGDISTAIDQVVGLHGFGISFGSKQLRMLCPNQCGVLDALVREACDYANTLGTYVQYCSDCSAQSELLNENGILTSCGQPWNVGAVDMAVFAWIRNRSIKKPWNCLCSNGESPRSKSCRIGVNPKTPANHSGNKIVRTKTRTARRYLGPTHCERPVNATDLKSSFFPGKAVESSFAKAKRIALEKNGRVPKNTPVKLELNKALFKCTWNGHGSITGHDRNWFEELGLGHQIQISFNAAKNSVVVAQTKNFRSG